MQDAAPTAPAPAPTPAPAPEPSPSHLTPRERIAQIRGERRQAAPAPAPAHVLTLETIDPEPRYVTVDGEDYRISFYDDFTLVQHARYAKLKTRADSLLAALPERADEDVDLEELEAASEEMHQIYGEMVRMILPTLPRETLGRMAFGQRQQVTLAFLTAQAERNARGTARAIPTARPTGGRSSTPSPSASAPASTTGSRSRRSASSSPPTTA